MFDFAKSILPTFIRDFIARRKRVYRLHRDIETALETYKTANKVLKALNRRGSDRSASIRVYMYKLKLKINRFISEHDSLVVFKRNKYNR